MTSALQNSENSGCEYQVAPDMAMTVRMIMILLYRAGGEPGRGEKPMIQIAVCSLVISCERFVRQGVLRTNIATATVNLGVGLAMQGKKVLLVTAMNREVIF